MTATLSGVSSMATRQILAELGASYERQGGCAVAITSIGGVEAVRRISAGEAFDLVVLAQNAMETLEASRSSRLWKPRGFCTLFCRGRGPLGRSATSRR